MGASADRRDSQQVLELLVSHAAEAVSRNQSRTTPPLSAPVKRRISPGRSPAWKDTRRAGSKVQPRASMDSDRTVPADSLTIPCA